MAGLGGGVAATVSSFSTSSVSRTEERSGRQEVGEVRSGEGGGVEHASILLTFTLDDTSSSHLDNVHTFFNLGEDSEEAVNVAAGKAVGEAASEASGEGAGEAEGDCGGDVAEESSDVDDDLDDCIFEAGDRAVWGGWSSD